MCLFRFFTLFLFIVSTSIHITASSFTKLQKDLEALTENYKAQIGIAVIINSKDTVLINNHLRYPLTSVFKFHQSLAVTHTLESQGQALDSLLYINKNELSENTYSPLRDKHPNTDLSLTVEELLQYTLLLSDNNACDILFRHIINVQKTNAYFQSLGINNLSIVATEEDMHQQTDLCYANWSSPLATVKLLELLLNDKLVKGEYKDFIINTMIQCETGKNRLPNFHHNGLTRIGHKTGTGDKNERGEIIGVNDIGFVLLPDGQHYTIAVFIKDSIDNLADTERIIAAISSTVYASIKESK